MNKKCTNCGAEFNEEENICKKCGKEIDKSNYFKIKKKAIRITSLIGVILIILLIMINNYIQMYISTCNEWLCLDYLVFLFLEIFVIVPIIYYLCYKWVILYSEIYVNSKSRYLPLKIFAIGSLVIIGIIIIGIIF